MLPQLMQLFIFTLFAIPTLAKPDNISQEIEDTVPDKRKCKSMRYQFKVKPGTSWGTMNQVQEAQWMSIRCDRFFCLPNNREGKGSYECIPLKSNG